MGVFRKKPEFTPPAPQMPTLGFVLLGDQLTNVTGLAAALEGTLGRTVEIDDGVLEIHTDDSSAFISVVNTPIPGGEAEANAARNYFWNDAVDRVAAHRAHLMVTVFGGPGEQVGRPQALAYARLFTTVLAAACGLDSAIGVYIGAHSIVHEAGPFRELAMAANADDVLPAPLLVHVMAAPQAGGGSAGYTRGLPTFGHDDLQIVDSQHSPDEVYRLLTNVVLYLLTSESYLIPGETLGYSDAMKLPITLADEARYFEGRALQIDY